MQAYWQQIEDLFRAHGVQPDDYFADGATETELAQVEETIGFPLPDAVRAFYRVHNGQRIGVHGVIFGIQLLSTADIISNWMNWKAIEGDGLNEDLADSMSSKPDGYIKKLYVNTKWIPLTHDQSGNHIGLDFDPDTLGTPGQVITFGRDDDQKKLIATSFEDYIRIYITQLQTIPWQLDPARGWDLPDRRHYHDWF